MVKMGETGMMLVSAECERLPGLAEMEITDRLLACFKEARNHWMVLDEEEQFKGALNAALNTSSGEEFDRLEQSIRQMAKTARMLQALQAGVPVDVEAMAKDLERQKAEGFDPIPLQKLWHETAK